MPLPLLLDLIACQQIKVEGYDMERFSNDDLMSILSVR